MRKGIAKDLEQALLFIENRTDQADQLFFAGPACSLLYFLAGKPNPTPYTDWPYFYLNPQGDHVMKTAVESKKVLLYVDWPGRQVATISFEKACPGLAYYLKKHFVPRGGGRRFAYWVRR
jgi:hypothetical protein